MLVMPACSVDPIVGEVLFVPPDIQLRHVLQELISHMCVCCIASCNSQLLFKYLDLDHYI